MKPHDALTVSRPATPVATREHFAADARPECVTLKAGATLSLGEAAPGTTIEPVTGDVWLTQTGDDRDILLAAGRAWSPEHAGKVVVQALTDARLRLRHPGQTSIGWRAMLGKWLHPSDAR